MDFEYFIVRRFVQARKKKNFISFLTYIAIVGVMIGTATLIIAFTILGGFEKTITEKIIGYAAHIRVQGFQAQPLHNYKSEMEKIRQKIPEVTQISPFIGKEAIIKSKNNIEGVFVNGIDSEIDFSSTRSQLIKGSYNLDVDPATGLHKIIIGNKIAKKLNIDVGDKIVLLGISGIPSPLNMPKIIQFQVSAIYETGMSEYDDINIYVSLDVAQNLFQMGESISGFNIKISDPQESAKICNKVMLVMGYPYYARSIFQMYKHVFTWIDLQKKPIPLILGLIIAVATFNIIGTLLMVVMEKTTEIGILKAIGASSKQIMKIFILEGIFIGIVGTVLGNLLAFVLCWIQLNYKIISIPAATYYMDTVPIYMQWSEFLLVSGISVVLCFCATLIPSFFASRLNPINSIKFS
jgi:lipoprotein-releasing system permease protein